MGREAAQEYERTEPVDVDPVLTARVRRIGNRLIAAAQFTQYPFEFHSVESNVVNAFSLPGGFIYFFSGLGQLTPGDDALAFILAHEISHVTQRHGVKQMEQSVAIAEILNLTLGPGTASNIIQLVVDMHYSRKDEAEADRLGLALMYKAGFDPSQGVEAMAVIARATDGGKSMPALLRSHPMPQTRIVALRREAAQLRAQPRPERPPVNTLPPLLTTALPPAPPGPVVRSELFPMTVGMSWSYRIAGAQPGQESTTTVLEGQPGRVGVYRVKTELGEGLSTTQLLAVTSEGVCTRGEPRHGSSGSDPNRAPQLQASAPVRTAVAEGPDAVPASQGQPATVPSDSAVNPSPGGSWHVDIQLPSVTLTDQSGQSWETVKVPAGEYRALRVLQQLPSGESAAVWLAPGTGIVRREWQRTGLVEELTSVHRPAQSEQRDVGTSSAKLPSRSDRPTGPRP
jgi:hypothetical protein